MLYYSNRKIHCIPLREYRKIKFDFFTDFIYNYLKQLSVFLSSGVLNFNLCGGTLSTAATTALLYQPRMVGDGDCGEIGGMKIGSGNQSTRRKPTPAPLCPPQIPHD
jgi:hypothetical protein